MTRTCSVNLAVSENAADDLPNFTTPNHLGVDQNFYFAKSKWSASITRKDVEEVVKQCQVCKLVDPVPVHWETRQVGVTEDWYRIATEMTRYNGVPYSTVIDCGSSRYVIWRKLRTISGCN